MLRSTEAPDRMELEGQDFHAKVADAYLKIAEEHPERFVVIDADKPGRGVRRRAGRSTRRGEREEGGGAGRSVGCRRAESVRRARTMTSPDPRLAHRLTSSVARDSVRRDVPVLDRVPGQVAAMAFLRRRGRAPAPRLRVRGSRGQRQVARRPGVRRGAAVQARADAASAAIAGSRSRTTTRTSSSSSPRAATSTSRRSATEVWHPAYRTAPEPGRKVFMVREADRLSPPAADTLLKVLEEPPADAVLLLLSARAHELPETVLSRCHVVTFTALPEALRRRGADPSGRRRGPGAARRASRRREPRPRQAARGRGGRSAVPGRRPRRDRARAAAGRPARSKRPMSCSQAAADYKKGMKTELDGGARALPRRSRSAGGGVPGRDQRHRDQVPAAGAPRRARLRGLGAARVSPPCSGIGGRRGREGARRSC